MFGDGPTPRKGDIIIVPYSPCVRGWPHDCIEEKRSIQVFPVCTGMALSQLIPNKGRCRVPHVYGDGPLFTFLQLKDLLCSPCIRGSPLPGYHAKSREWVFLVCAGMALIIFQVNIKFINVPRVCGDGPMSMAQAMEMISCSPCVRGWPFERDMIVDRMQVFPVCAGMAPASPWRAKSSRWCSPCVRGWPYDTQTICLWGEVFLVCTGMALAAQELK